MATTTGGEREYESFGYRGLEMQPLLLTIPAAAAALAIGRTTLYELIAAGEIDVVHIGRSSRVPADAIREFVAAKRAQD